MPAAYAHYRFGTDVLALLPHSLRETIVPYEGLYCIGLHGPDLLFYCHALHDNPVIRLGHAMHNQPGRVFFQNALPALSPLQDAAPSLAYLCGFLCHFALDSVCHPYIEQAVRETGLSHSELEAELDRFCMKKDGRNPMTYQPIHHISANGFYAETIARFFPELTRDQVLSCIRSMRRNCALLSPPGRVLHTLLPAAMKAAGISASISDMVIRPRPNSACHPVCEELDRRYSQAEADAVRLIRNLRSVRAGTAPWDPLFDHTFGET